MRKRLLIARLGISATLLVAVLLVASLLGVRVLAGQLSIGVVGVDGYWVNPSSVRVKGTDEARFRLYNDSEDTRTFRIEKITPYDASLQDAGDRVTLLDEVVELEGKTEGTFSVQVEGKGSPGESWIRITADSENQVRSALIVRIKVGS